MEESFATQIILAKAKSIVEDGRPPDIGVVIELLQTKESVQASMVPVAHQKQAGEDLYMYRFKVPVGGIYRFRLSARLSPAMGRAPPKQPPSVQPNVPGTRFVDYAISRAAADDGICSKHFQPHTHGHELHLGEADYLALLAHGQCACPATTITAASFTSKGGCYKCPPFAENRGREIGDVPANAGLGAKVDCCGKVVQRKEDLAAWPPEHFEQRGWASGELPTQESSEEAAASYPVPDEPATADLDALFLALDESPDARRRAVERKKEEDAFRERGKWDGVCALSGEDGDSLQRRLLQPETSVLLKPGDKEVKVDEEKREELEGDLLLSCRTPATSHEGTSSRDPTGVVRLNSSVVGREPGLAPAGVEPLAPAVRLESSVSAPAGEEPWATAFHPASVHAPAGDEPLAQAVRPEPSVPTAAGGDEPWTSSSSAVETRAETRETYVFERCQRNCVHASSEKENILFVVFGDQRTFRLPKLTESSRQIICSMIPPLPSDVVREILQVISGNRIFRLLDESDSAQPRHAIDGSDFEPLLLPTIDESDPVLMKPQDAKGGKQNSRASMLQPLSSEDSEAASESSSSGSAARRATAADADADAIVVLSEDVEATGYGNAESLHVDFQVRFRLWKRARLVVIRAFQLVRDFFRGLFRGRRGGGGVRGGQPSSGRSSGGSRWCRRRSNPSWTSDAERVECDDLSKV